MVRHVLGPRVYDPKSAGKTDNKSMGGPSIVQVATVVQDKGIGHFPLRVLGFRLSISETKNPFVK